MKVNWVNFLPLAYKVTNTNNFEKLLGTILYVLRLVACEKNLVMNSLVMGDIENFYVQ